MADSPLRPDSGHDTGDRESTASRPRWVYVVGIIAVVLVLLFVVLHLMGGGLARHTPP